jgi:hypothetical protein
MFAFSQTASHFLSLAKRSLAIAEETPEKANVAVIDIEFAVGCLKGAYKTAVELAEAKPAETSAILSEAEVFNEAILEVETYIDIASMYAAAADAAATSSVTTGSSSNTSDTDVDATSTCTGALAIEAPPTSVTSDTNPDASSTVRKSSELHQDEEKQAKKQRMMTVAEDVEVDVRKLASFSKKSLKTLEKLCDFPSAYTSLERFELTLQPHHIINLESVFDDVKKTIDSSAQEVDEMLEITRYSLITPFLNALAEKMVVKHWGQYSLRDGTLAQGSTDWALIYKGLPVFIIEGKRYIRNSGVAQLVLQMYEAYMKLGQRGTKEDPWVMYGMVTTATKVVFIKTLFCGEDLIEIKWNGGVFSVPHEKTTVVDDYIDGMSPVARHMEAMLDKQKKQVDKALGARTQQQQQP